MILKLGELNMRALDRKVAHNFGAYVAYTKYYMIRICGIGRSKVTAPRSTCHTYTQM